MNESSILSWMVFFPLVGMGLIILIPGRLVNVIRTVAAVATGIPLIEAIYLFIHFNRAEAGFQFVQKTPWISLFNVEYFVGVDGLSITMVLLTALLSFICIFASFGIQKGVKGYYALFLLLVTGMMGVFVALDFFLFYIFWEVMLLPMYFLIGIWGGPKKEYAAIKFFLYTLFGSVLMLIAMLAFYFGSDINPSLPGAQHTFSLVALQDPGVQTGWLATAVNFRWALFILLFIGFAIKVPLFPFHTWLPLAHVEAPTAVSVILAGVLLKMGTYGILRISYPLLPDIARDFAIWLGVLGVINIIYGALCAMAQTDLKRLVAYSSISHMGFVCLGMASFTEEGINGAVFQMFNHGTITAMLFLLVGVIYDRAHHREINGFGGLGQRMPVYTGMTALAFFAALGLPGLSGFISEVLVLLGSFSAGMEWFKHLTVLATLGIVLGAGYLLWTMQRMFLGPLNEKYANLPDINGREMFTLVPLACIVIVLGIFPMHALNLINASLTQLLTVVH
jgi:NADH-quinone oxidoreductase subunit M